MAVDKLVDSTQLDADLTDVADEIRTAGGTLLPLSFPDDYVVAIGDIGNTEIKTASGSIAHFEDALARKAQNLTVAVEPVQDLHGYDNPWPAGGGKNLFDKAVSETWGGTVSADGQTITSSVRTAEGNDNSMRVVFSHTFNIVSGDAFYVSFDCKLVAGTVTSFGFQLVGGSKFAAVTSGKYGNVPTSTSQRITARVTATTDAELKGLYIQATKPNGMQLEISNIMIATTEDYVYSPYSNICPISGWAGANVTRTGRNLLNLSSLRGGEFDSVRTLPAYNISTNDYLPIKGGQEYVWSQKRYPTGSGRYVRWYDIDKLQIGSVNIYSDSSYPLTAPDNACFARFMWYLPTQYQSIDDIIADEPMIQYGSTASAYEPYAGNTYSITFPSEAGTVYGGTLDVTTGKLTVTGKKVVYNGSEHWAKHTSGSAGAFSMQIATNEQFVPGKIYANYLKTISINETWGNFDNWISWETNNQIIATGIQSITTVQGWKDYLAQNNLEVIYFAETPATYQLTPTEVTTLLGTNNVWADTGDSTIKYIAPKAQIPSAQGVSF